VNKRAGQRGATENEHTLEKDNEVRESLKRTVFDTKEEQIQRWQDKGERASKKLRC